MRIKEKSYWIDFGNNAYITNQKAFHKIVNICDKQLINFKISSDFIYSETGKKVIVTLEIEKSWGPFLVTELANLD